MTGHAVIIAGGGPTGLTLAAELALAGIDVAIVGDNKLQDFIEAAAVFEVADGNVRGRPAQPDGKSSVYMSHRWTLPS